MPEALGKYPEEEVYSFAKRIYLCLLNELRGDVRDVEVVVNALENLATYRPAKFREYIERVFSNHDFELVSEAISCLAADLLRISVEVQVAVRDRDLDDSLAVTLAVIRGDFGES